ncbi:hypothetical protein RvY_13403 [Ramazzottius varieornatus]|uniref:G-protein coupled receptors family 2 profile 2 domain-containing protein n=1 Tax=Ramazzottius varieornatus TaxID=947166 RepID=A0A1D1VMS5_RAMVA|nr:hypothetical protein RvY_13403 [Ramazzottius varieornatus]
MDGQCRNELGRFPVDAYLNITCALCYIYTFHSTDPLLYPLTYESERLLRYLSPDNVTEDRILPPAASTLDSPVYRYGFPEWHLERDSNTWNRCCQAAVKCCYEQLERKNEVSSGCPMTWDGWQCWPTSPQGSITKQSCPSHINPSSLPVYSGFAEKTCLDNGEWFRLDEEDSQLGYNLSRNSWTNYTSCFSVTPLENRSRVQIFCYSVSIIFLVPAFLMFACCKQLRQHQRNVIHAHFFLSLLVNAIMLIIFQSLVTQELLHDPEAFINNKFLSVECRLIYAFTMYLRLCNYCWMFCEGLFLLRHLRHVFMQDQWLLSYYAMGWGLPGIPVGLYISRRFPETGCWIAPSEGLEWILKSPALLVLSLNFCFLVYILTLLVRKPQQHYGNVVLAKLKASTRAILVLFPLFGLHFGFTGYRPSDTCGMQWYFYLNNALDGLQGLWVALVFCYFNSEVAALLMSTTRILRDRATLGRSLSLNSAGSVTYTAGFSLGGARYNAAARMVKSPSTETRITHSNSVVESIKISPRKHTRVKICRYESLMRKQKAPKRQTGVLSSSTPNKSEDGPLNPTANRDSAV